MSNLHRRARTESTSVVLAVLVLLVAVPIASAVKTEQVRTASYRVFGSTERAIRASLDARRPGEYDARTQWFVNWSYDTAMRNGTCVVSSRTVRTRINFTYPAWTAPASATRALRTKWATYLSRLRVHEAGHAANGRLTAARIDAVLRTGTAADCATLDRDIRAKVAAHLKTGNAADVAYDKRTKHGETQGAVFP